MTKRAVFLLFVLVLVGFGSRRKRASLVGGVSSAQKRYISAFVDPLVKIGDIKYRRNVFTVTRLQVVLIATTACCHWDKLGNVLRTVFDTVQEPNLSVRTEGVGVGESESILLRPPRCSQ